MGVILPVIQLAGGVREDFPWAALWSGRRPREAAWGEAVRFPSVEGDSSPQRKGRGLQGQLQTGGERKFPPPTGAHPGQIKRWKPNHSQVRIHHRILRTGSVFFAYWELTKNPREKKDRREIRVKENVNYKLAPAKSICQELNNKWGVCRLPLWRWNPVLPQLLIFNICWGSPGWSEALCAPGNLMR